MSRKSKSKYYQSTKITIISFVILIFLAALVVVFDYIHSSMGYPPLLFNFGNKKVSVVKQQTQTKEKKSSVYPTTPIKSEKHYKSKANEKSYKARAAIIIDDIGMDIDIANKLLSVEAPINFSVLPFLKYSKISAELIHSKHKVVMAHIPMETINPHKMTPGFPWLLVGMNPSKIIKNLNSILSNIPYVQGCNNHTGSRFTADKKGMTIVLNYMKKNGLFFVDSRTTANTVAYSLAQKINLPSAERKVFFDDVETKEAISLEFQKLIRLALKNGSVVGIGHPKPETVVVLKKYVPILKKAGIKLVPITELLKPKLNKKFTDKIKLASFIN